MKKTLAILLAVCLMFTSLFSLPVFAEGETTFAMTELEGKYKAQGRTILKDGALLVHYPASGIEFNAYCSGDVYVNFNVIKLGYKEGLGGCFFTVIVDGETKDRSTCHIIETGEVSIKIAEGLEEGNHTFELYRQNEISHAKLGIKSITLNGEFLPAPEDKDMYIEIIGDSVTGGWGNLGDSTTPGDDSAIYQDATQAYSYLTARNLDADWSVISVAGIGAYWSSPGNYSMSTAYDYYGYANGKDLYDFENSRKPDYIVIGLSTNDYNKAERNGKTKDDLYGAFEDFIRLVRSKNPTSKIVWIHGVVNHTTKPYIEEAVKAVGGADYGVYTAQVTPNTDGVDSHVSTEGGKVIANEIAARIREIEAENKPFISELPPKVSDDTNTDSDIITEAVGKAIIESDFHKPEFNSSASSADKANMSMWQSIGTVDYLDDNGDGTTDFARVTAIETDKDSKASALYSSTAVLNPGNTYELSFKIRVPQGTDYKDFLGYIYGGSSYDFAPEFALYQPTNTEAGKRVNNVYSQGQNDYAYSYDNAEHTTKIRRTAFSTVWNIENYGDISVDGASCFNRDLYYSVKDENGNKISPNTAFGDWTTVTMRFKAIEDAENVGPQVVAFVFRSVKGAVGLAYDIKDFSLVCTDNCTVKNTIMESDFNDADGTYWQGTRNNVVYGDSNNDGVNDYARVSSSTAAAGVGFVSTPFELVNGKEYELSFYLRIPEESKSYNTGTFYAPSFTLYEPKVNSKGTKVETASNKSEIASQNNYYAYKQSAKAATDTAAAVEAWTRRQNFSAEWTVEGYGSLTRTPSTFTYKDHEKLLGSANDAKNLYSDWTKITAKFTAVADEDGEKSQIAALNFHFLDLSKTAGYMFDIKDVALTTSKSKFNSLPDTSDAVYYNSFENIFDASEAGVTVYGEYNLESDWAETKVVHYEGTTGKNSVSVYAYGAQYIFIPVDKELLAPNRTYNFSLDFKLPATANEGETRMLNEITFIGYNNVPTESLDDPHRFVDTRKILGGRVNDKNTLTITGEWQSFAQTATISVEDYEAYEQFGICIRYPKAKPADATKEDNTIQIDNIMVTTAPVYGDANGDYDVTLEDVTIMARALAGWGLGDIKVDVNYLDVNNDKKHNLKDLILIAQKAAGWDVELL